MLRATVLGWLVVGLSALPLRPVLAAGEEGPAVVRGVQFLRGRVGSLQVGETALAGLALVKAEVPASDSALQAALRKVQGRFHGSIFTPERQGFGGPLGFQLGGASEPGGSNDIEETAIVGLKLQGVVQVEKGLAGLILLEGLVGLGDEPADLDAREIVAGGRGRGGGWGRAGRSRTAGGRQRGDGQQAHCGRGHR